MSAKALLCLFLLALVADFTLNLNPAEVLQSNAALEAALEPKARSKRGAFWDFFQKLVVTKNLVADQFVDTKNTLNEVYNLVNEGFSDPAPAKPTVRPPTNPDKSDTTEDSSGETTTTTEKYSISRYEFGRILGRNLRGLQRLANIEFQDAFNQSKYNIAEYQAEARKQFANSLTLEKKKHLKKLVG